MRFDANIIIFHINLKIIYNFNSSHFQPNCQLVSRLENGKSLESQTFCVAFVVSSANPEKSLLSPSCVPGVLADPVLRVGGFVDTVPNKHHGMGDWGVGIEVRRITCNRKFKFLLIFNLRKQFLIIFIQRKFKTMLWEW